jgi:hypothetical protein
MQAKRIPACGRKARKFAGFVISLFFCWKIVWGSPTGVEHDILCRTFRAPYLLLVILSFGSDTAFICCLPRGWWL